MATQQTHAEMFDILRDSLWAFGDIPYLSSITGISVSTLYKYRSSGKNHPWPRYKTWEALLPPLGLRLILSKI